MRNHHIICWIGGCLIIAVSLVGCNRPDAKTSGPPKPVDVKKRKAVAISPDVKFKDLTTQAGIQFQHQNGGFGQKFLPESLGGGCAFFDFDNDGKQDLLLINSCRWPGYEEKEKPAPTMALYRNKGDGTFADVTAAAGLKVTFYGMGVAVGDFDNDGWTDIFITGVGGNHLFKNSPDEKGGRKFVDVTKAAGDLTDSWNWPTAKADDFLKLDTPISFPSSAAFLDYDKDGLLDLFVCNYVTWSPHYDLTQGFTLAGLGRAYGPPTTFPGAHCQLYRNNGNGGFENVTRKAGIEVFDEFRKPVAKALGVIVCDVDEDGWPDIVVANDTVRNFLFHNQGNGTFREKGQEAGVAFVQGVARGAMGIDFGEYRSGRVENGKNQPGQCALVIGNFANEPDALLRLDNPKRLLFTDVAAVEGIEGPSRITLTFGAFYFDYDLDGRLDYLALNGHLEPEINKVQSSQHYRQPAQLFWNTGDIPAFEETTFAQCGGDLFAPLVGRGSAFADIDGNGALDLILMENGGPAKLLKNEGLAGQNWVRLALEGNGKTTNKSAIGARVTLSAGDQVQKREVVGTRGYLSSSELVLTIGLGKTDKIDRVEIIWPGRDATPQVITDLAINKEHRIQQK